MADKGDQERAYIASKEAQINRIKALQAELPGLDKQMKALVKLHNRSSGEDREKVREAMDELERITREKIAQLDADLEALNLPAPHSLRDDAEN